MYLHILGRRIHVSPFVLAIVTAAVGGVVLTLLIIFCCWCWCCCCRRKKIKDKKDDPKIHVENPPEEKGNVNAGSAQQSQHQNAPQKMPESPTGRNYSSTPLPTQPSAQQPQSTYTTRSNQDSMGSTNTGSTNASHSSVGPVPSFGSSQTMFSYDELAIATNGFSRGNILGQGGFGFVHKGVLPTGKEIAVKSLKADGNQGEREFQAEVEIISRVHHKHLVSLVGYCMAGSQRLLVYELVPNKTLEFHLHGKRGSALDWPTRMKIALGAAKGLAYLHEDCHPKIIHRDIKGANILIDNNFEAKVADFGLAKFSSLNDTHIATRVMGTLGYLAPEYASSGQVSAKSDVFSFGVMLLELITGRRPFDKTQNVSVLSEWARPLLTTAIEGDNYDSLVDPQIQHSYKHDEMSRMVYSAATCIRKSARHRPLMSQVVRALEGNLSVADLSVGVTPGRSIVNRYESTSEYSGSQYTRTSKGYGSSEVGRTTSEYGLDASSSSSEAQTTREMDNDESINRERRHPRQRF